MANEKIIQQNIRTSLERTKQEWSDHLSGKKENVILMVAWKLHPERRERAQQVLGWIDNALQTDTLAGYQELYQKWNGNPDLNKYNAENDAGAALSSLRDYLDEWVNPSAEQQKLDNYEETKNKLGQNLPGLLDQNGKINDNKLNEIKKELEKVKPLEEIIQAAGIDPQSENAKEEASSLKKVTDDLKELKIDKSRLKEIIIGFEETIEGKVGSEYLEQILEPKKS